VASLSQGRTAAAQCGLFTHKSVPVIFEPPCTFPEIEYVTKHNKYIGLVFTEVCRHLNLYICRRTWNEYMLNWKWSSCWNWKLEEGKYLKFHHL